MKNFGKIFEEKKISSNFFLELGDNKCKKIALTYSGWFSFACMLIN